MSNSNGIKAALNVMKRVRELKDSGLKLKEHKSELRNILCELANEVPSEVLVAVSRAVKSVSNEVFFSRLTGAIVDAEWALKVAEQMDEKHAEALEMNEAHDRAEEINMEAMHAEALEMNAAMSMPVTETKFTLYRVANDFVRKAIFDGDHAQALDIDYCVEAVKEGGGYLGGYVVQNPDVSFQVLGERTTTGNPLKATYFTEADYRLGRMKQFCFNGEIPVRLGDAVLAVAGLAK